MPEPPDYQDIWDDMDELKRQVQEEIDRARQDAQEELEWQEREEHHG